MVLKAGYAVLWIMAPLLALAGPVAVGQLGQIHNADSLLIPALYDDLFVAGYGMSGWKLPGSLYVYPDLFLYAILRLPAGSTVVAAALFAHVQFAAFFFLWRVVLRECTAPAKWWRLEACMGPALAIFIVCISFSGKPEAFLDLFRMAHHTGSALVSLLGLYLTLRWLRTGKKYLLVLIFLNAGLSALSDQVYLITGLLPVLVALAACFGRFRRAAVWAALAQSAAVLLMEPVRRFLHQVFRMHNFIGRALDGLKHESAGEVLAKGASTFARSFAEYYGAPFTILFLLCFVAVLIVLVRRPASRATPARFDAPDALRFLLICLVVLTPLLIFASMVVGLVHYGRAFQPRYLALPITAPFFILPLLVLTFWRPWKTAPPPMAKIIGVWASAALLGMLMVVLPARFGPAKIIAPFQFQHITADCLDKHAKKLNLKYGLGDYWAAKPVTLFSRKGLRVNQLTPDLNIFYWVNNLNWYLEKDPEYDFLIMDRINAKAVARAFGAPAKRLNCGPSEVFLYNRPEKDARFRKQFIDEKRIRRLLTGGK